MTGIMIDLDIIRGWVRKWEKDGSPTIDGLSGSGGHAE